MAFEFYSIFLAAYGIGLFGFILMINIGFWEKMFSFHFGSKRDNGLHYGGALKNRPSQSKVAKKAIPLEMIHQIY